jgi:hypothetical protein
MRPKERLVIDPRGASLYAYGNETRNLFMKKHEDGFGAVGLVLVIVVAAVIGFAGWRVYSANNKTTPSPTITTSTTHKSYTDTAKRFTFSYPDNWTTSFAEKGGMDGPEQAEPDWTVVSRPVLVKPLVGQKDNNVAVTPGCSASTIAAAKAQKDKFHTQEDTKINGYTALYDKLDFKADAESYLDHKYIIVDKNDCVEISFRENWHHDMSNTNFDDSKNLPGFQAIVNSVKFLN